MSQIAKTKMDRIESKIRNAAPSLLDAANANLVYNEIVVGKKVPLSSFSHEITAEDQVNKLRLFNFF